MSILSKRFAGWVSQCIFSHRLRPQLVDPDDEFVLEAAYHGMADLIVTLNTRDFLTAARRFGIAAMRPGEALERIRHK
jgi:predicted nucleic acid-binding protein